MRRSRSHASGDEGHGSGMERWLLTYSDMITLLLALFVILFALSSINSQKFMAFELGITKSFGGHDVPLPSSEGLLPSHDSLLFRPSAQAATPPAPPPSTPPSTPPAPSRSSPSLAEIASELDAALASAGLGADASISVTEHGVVVQMLADKAYFANDSAALGTVGDAIVDVIAGVLRSVPNAVEVQGYTDDVPITGGPFTSNWELSAVRAVNVVQRLEEVGGITKNRLSAIGYGTTHPVAPNTTASGQAENRRIDVVVLTVALSASGAAAAAQGSQ